MVQVELISRSTEVVRGKYPYILPGGYIALANNLQQISILEAIPFGEDASRSSLDIVKDVWGPEARYTKVLNLQTRISEIRKILPPGYNITRANPLSESYNGGFPAYRMIFDEKLKPQSIALEAYNALPDSEKYAYCLEDVVDVFKANEKEDPSSLETARTILDNNPNIKPLPYSAKEKDKLWFDKGTYTKLVDDVANLRKKPTKPVPESKPVTEKTARRIFTVDNLAIALHCTPAETLKLPALVIRAMKADSTIEAILQEGDTKPCFEGRHYIRLCLTLLPLLGRKTSETPKKRSPVRGTRYNNPTPLPRDITGLRA